jgi:flagellar biosynthesis protein FliR
VAADPAQAMLAALAVGAARTVPLTLLVPALGGPRTSARVRVGLGLMLAVLALPALSPALGSAPLSALGAPGWLLLLGRELLVGLTLGFAAGMLFRAAEAAGRLADVLRGANMGEALSPESGERPSPLADLYLMLAIVVFLELGGLRILADALARSYEAVPLSGPAAVSSASVGKAATLVTLVTAKLVESAVGLSAPVMVAMLLADVALGLLARAAPQIPIHFAALPARALLGLGTVLIGVGALAAALVAGIPSWRALLDRALLIFL